MSDSTMDRGEDPSKWVVKKSAFGYGWVVHPPHDGEVWIVRKFPFRVPSHPSDPCPWRHNKDVDYWELGRRQAGCLANLKHDRCTCVTFEDEQQAQQPTRYAGKTTYDGQYNRRYRA